MYHEPQPPVTVYTNPIESKGPQLLVTVLTTNSYFNSVTKEVAEEIMCVLKCVGLSVCVCV